MSSTNGFKPDFIDHTLVVDLPVLTKQQFSDLVLIDTPPNAELKYPHFSLYLSKSRRFPYFTATNIDGALFKKIPRGNIFPSGNDEWSIDDRASNYQWGSHLYSAVKSDFQRGHMTKREDPQWGHTEQEALEAARATFHFSNCVPQLGDLNTKDWGKLETYILSKQSVPGQLKVSVLTGPVLTDNDPIFVTEVDGQQVAIPTLFWKIVYYTNNGKELSRAAFLMGQENELYKKKIVVQKPNANLYEIAESRASYFQDFEDAAIYQVNISTIEQLTKLKFSPAQEPFQDTRPLKLIIDKVQIPAGVQMLNEIDALIIDEDTNEQIQFSNIRLESPVQILSVEQALNLVNDLQPTVQILSANGPQQQYTDDLKKHFGYYAAWNPGLELQLGDIGLLRGNVFTRIGNLRHQNIDFQTNENDKTPADLKYNSKGAVTITTKLSGTATPAGSSLTSADAGLIIDFNKENAIVFQADQTLTSTIDDVIGLGSKVMDSFRNGRWDKNWAIITELVTAKSGTVLISSSAGAKIELKVNANINFPKLDLADASLQLTTQFSRSMDTSVVAQTGMTPLFKLMRIQSSIFSSPDFKPMGISALDLLTPELAKEESSRDKITFSEI